MSGAGNCRLHGPARRCLDAMDALAAAASVVAMDTDSDYGDGDSLETTGGSAAANVAEALKLTAPAWPRRAKEIFQYVVTYGQRVQR